MAWKRDRGEVHDVIGPRARDGVAHLCSVRQLGLNPVLVVRCVLGELADVEALRAQAGAQVTAREAIRTGDEDPRS